MNKFTAPYTHRLNTKWQWPLSGVHSIMMEKLAQAGLGRGFTPTPFSLYLPSRTKRGQIHSPYFISTPMYSVEIPEIHITVVLRKEYFDCLQRDSHAVHYI